ncbi:MAG: hypothetical protein RLZZ609_740 [Cyanobacteriota bacterium]|jgi:hypothetical protein
MRDCQHPVALEDLLVCGARDLMLWQGRLMAGVEQGGRGGDDELADGLIHEGVEI